MKDELRKYIKENLIIEKKTIFGKRKASAYIDQESINYEVGEAFSKDISNYYDISSYINQKKDYNDFQTLLFKYIDDKGLKDSDVYNKVHLDRRLFSKIRSDKNYHPSKDTIILLGLSLELSEDEIVNLLDSASYSLPKNNYFDLIIRFCFINKIYKVTKVNELLDEYHCRLFNY